jgi:membrane protease subunit (stomatin/prohibitin family)
MGLFKRKRDTDPIELPTKTTVGVHSEVVDASNTDLGEQIRHTLEAAGIQPGQNRVIDAGSIPGLSEEIMAALQQSGAMAAAFGNASLDQPAQNDPVAQLAQLAELHKKGHLSDYEFAEAKEKILNQSWQPPAS